MGVHFFKKPLYGPLGLVEFKLWVLLDDLEDFFTRHLVLDVFKFDAVYCVVGYFSSGLVHVTVHPGRKDAFGFVDEREHDEQAAHKRRFNPGDDKLPFDDFEIRLQALVLDFAYIDVIQVLAQGPDVFVVKPVIIVKIGKRMSLSDIPSSVSSSSSE